MVERYENASMMGTENATMHGCESDKVWQRFQKVLFLSHAIVFSIELEQTKRTREIMILGSFENILVSH